MTMNKLTNLLDSTMHVVSQAIREIDDGEVVPRDDNSGLVREALCLCLETLRQADADLDADTVDLTDLPLLTER
ncbi:hypothetical protein LCGC14_1498260 [marine sediment metagenome]|uniref:Uncharacterized protein n=1 Tax=marine sediment metagenome TaxID=412755 RepID=A0A0F9M689_9ZZZZ